MAGGEHRKHNVVRFAREEKHDSVDEPYEDFAERNDDWDRRVQESIRRLRETPAPHETDSNGHGRAAS